MSTNKLKKIVVRFQTMQEGILQDFDISYLFMHENKSKISAIHILNEILNILIKDEKLSMPKEIIITVDVKIKANHMFHTDEKTIQKNIIKTLSDKFPFDKPSMIIQDMTDFLFNLYWYIQELESYSNILNKNVSFTESV